MRQSRWPYLIVHTASATLNWIECSIACAFVSGLTGHVNLSPDADRLPSFLLWDMRPDNTFRVVLNITYFKTDSGRVVLVS